MSHRKRHRVLVTGLLFLGLVLAACAQLPIAGTASASPLEGTFWLLESYVDGQGEEHSVLPRTQVSIVFQDGKVNGSDGCNQFFGAYTLDGSQLTIEPQGSTMMACPDLIMEQASAFTAGLTNTTQFEIKDQTLTLKGVDGGIVQVLQAASQELAGSSWQAIAINNGKRAVASVIEGTQITAVFDADGRVTGSAGCNDFNGSYETEGKHLTIGPLATTRKFCSQPEGVMEQESAYLAALEKSTTYELAGTNLTLRDDQGATQVEFIKP